MPHSSAFFADEGAFDPAETLRRMTLDFERPLLKVCAHRSGFSEEIGAETAPLPLLGFFHQSPLHWVAVYVTELLDVFPFRPHVEIVETFLPDLRRFAARNLPWDPTHRKGRDEWGTRLSEWM